MFASAIRKIIFYWKSYREKSATQKFRGCFFRIKSKELNNKIKDIDLEHIFQTPPANKNITQTFWCLYMKEIVLWVTIVYSCSLVYEIFFWNICVTKMLYLLKSDLWNIFWQHLKISWPGWCVDVSQKTILKTASLSVK